MGGQLAWPSTIPTKKMSLSKHLTTLTRNVREAAAMDLPLPTAVSSSSNCSHTAASADWPRQAQSHFLWCFCIHTRKESTRRASHTLEDFGGAEASCLLGQKQKERHEAWSGHFAVSFRPLDGVPSLRQFVTQDQPVIRLQACVPLEGCARRPDLTHPEAMLACLRRTFSWLHQPGSIEVLHRRPTRQTFFQLSSSAATTFCGLGIANFDIGRGFDIPCNQLAWSPGPGSRNPFTSSASRSRLLSPSCWRRAPHRPTSLSP